MDTTTSTDRRRIMVIEDDPDLRGTLVQLLRDEQLTADGHESGELALAGLDALDPDLAIVDLRLPGMSGFDVVAAIRARSDIPIIILTAQTGSSEVVAGLEAGADDYMTKPSDPNELRARMAIGARIIDLETRLRASRDTDELTGLRNRRALTAAANAELAHAQRAQSKLSIVLLDVDHFKQVNDQYGHQTGDQVLQLIGRTVAESIRPQDLVGRWGGEEFLLLLPEIEPAHALAIAERIRVRIELAVLQLADQSALQVTASLGVASTASEDDYQLDALMYCADVALYRAKAEGRNCVRAAELAAG